MNIELSLVREFEELYNKFDKNRKGLLEIEGIDKEHLDTGYLSRKFFSERLADISTNTNANLAERQGIAEYKSFTNGGIQKLLGYNDFYYYIKREKGKRYADKVISAIWDGHVYLHDAHGSDLRKVYCFATSLDKIVYLGRPYGDLHDDPPKHTKSFLSQVDKFVHDMGVNLAGACALSDLLIWYTYFFKNEMGITNRCLWDDSKILDPVCEKKFINDMQGFIHLLNNNNRVDGDVIFSNISIFDVPNLKNLFGHIVYPDGSTPDFDLIMKLQKEFCKFFAKGREDGLPYKFPVVTFNIQTKDGLPVDNSFIDFICNVNLEKGNFNIHMGDESRLSMCCRYVLDLDEMSQWSSDSFGNGGVNLGSHRVMTINIPLVMAESRTAYEFYEKMEYYMDLVAESLYIHREYILKERFNKNPDFNPFFGRLGWFDVDTMLFSTFGITGVWDAEVYAKNNNINITALQILNFMQRRIKNYTNKYNRVYNIEQIPAEQTAVTLAKKSHWHGKLLDVGLYANQYIPLTESITPEYRLEYSGKCSNIITGGDIVHINIGHKLDTPNKIRRIIEWAIKYGVPHFAINYTFAECECGHNFIADGMDNIICPVCGAEVDNFLTRIIGYFSHTQNWNKTRRDIDMPNRRFRDI